MTPRIFIGTDARNLAPGTEYALARAAARHVGQVLRMRAGDALTLFTGTGGEYATTLARIDRNDVVVRVEQHDAVERESPWPVILVQSLIASDMMDFVVRKAVELGVAAIAPVQSVRSQAVPPERAARRVEHWRHVAIAACEQCGRNRVPPIDAVVPLAEWIRAWDSSQRAVLLDAAAARSLASQAAVAPPAAVMVGPEGGFTPEESRNALARGAVAVHVGRRVLRAETAALAALATVGGVAGDAK